MTAFWCEQAWLAPGPVAGVRGTVAGGVISSVETEATPGPADHRLPGPVLPGLADAHSQAFHRALRGRTHDRGGTFWTWRQAMYAVAGGLDPDSYLALAQATYAEMALAGVTCVGEFHYLHHAPGGHRYADPNALGWPDAGRIAAGQHADLVAVRLDSPRTAGVDPAQAVMTAGAADVSTVVVDGPVVVAGGRHVLGDVGRLLSQAIGPLWAES